MNCQNTDCITYPTRDSNILDHCYTLIEDAYHPVPRAALVLSDHCLVHLIPTYRQKLKLAKPVLRTFKRWTNETERVLQASFELTGQTPLSSSWSLLIYVYAMTRLLKYGKLNISVCKPFRWTCLMDHSWYPVTFGLHKIWKESYMFFMFLAFN